MKRKITKAVQDASRENGKRSGGPLTAEGKRRSSQNALIHGFFARELILSGEDKQLLDVCRRALEAQLSPETVLQHVAFGEIVSCIGRCKLALRQEMRRVTKMLAESTAEPTQRGQTDASTAARDWYLSGRQGLREGLRLLEAVQQEFLRLERIDERWHAALDQAFGAQFRKLLTEWAPSDLSAVMIAHQLTEHQKLYGGSLPFSREEPDSKEGEEKVPKVILDPEQNKQMILKLLELEKSVVSDLWKSSDQRDASDSARAQTSAVDFAPRYFSTACRDLHRAVAWYIQLKKEGL